MPERDPEFGLTSPLLGLALMLPALLPTFGGWWLEFEDSWWSSDRAILCWTVLAPTLLVLPGFLWRPGSWRWLGALVAFGMTAAPFAVAVCLREGQIDAEGLFLGVFVGLCALGGFLLGVLLHTAVRWVRSA
ncbi:MAG: hypothetical protein ABIO70_28465 [Pseudomonadota bacterium]